MLLMLTFITWAILSSLALAHNYIFFGVVFLLTALGLLMIAIIMIIMPLVKFV